VGLVATPHSDLKIHQLSKLSEFTEAVRLQREIWGFENTELLPARLFVVASKIGGQVLGAFDGNKMIAFCLCIPGLKPGGKYYLHSHMLGVLPPYRDSGIGRKLKWKQREFALASEVDLIEWTFDPLEIKNAFFNIERLGAVMRRYVHNQYGTTTSPLHGGLPTDRLIAEWWLRTDRVMAREQGLAFERSPVEAQISVPLEIAQIREHDPRRARDIQRSLADQFDRHFRHGLTVVDFEKDNQLGTYLLGQWESK
jgi:predicted GNAT superfamily acetyltransferase